MLQKTYYSCGSCKSLAFFTVLCSQTVLAQDIANGSNLYGITVINGDTWNLLGDAYLSNNVSTIISKYLPPTLTINGATDSIITLNDGNGHYAQFSGSSTNLAINNVTFSGGNTNTNGGVINAGSIIISGGPVTFDSNFASGTGGAIKTTGSVVFTGGDVILTNNTSNGDATSSGGAIYALSIAFTNPSANLTVTGNDGLGSGGGLWSNNAVTIAGNAIFSDNTSGLARRYGYGGAIRTISFTANNPDATLIFSNNAAYSGGGGLNGDSTITIAGTSIFTGNTTETGFGGAIRIGTGNHTLQLTNADATTVLDENFAGNNGGGMYVGNVQIAGSLSLTDNTAGVNGGGIFSNNMQPDNIGNSNATIDITGNKAGFDRSDNAINTNGNGGAIYSNSALTLVGKTINLSENQATGNGGAFWLLGNSLMYGKIAITSNTATNGGAIYSAAPATIIATGDTVVSNNHASVLGGAFWMDSDLTLNADTGNILFQNNQQGTDSSTTANALYMNNSAGTALLNLEATDGHNIIFLDPVESNPDNGPIAVDINQSGGSGNVIFSGELYDNAADRSSAIYGNTNIYAGSLELKDSAVYGAIDNPGNFQLYGPANLITTATRANTVNIIRAQSVELVGNTAFTGPALHTLAFEGDVIQSGELQLANGAPGNSVKIAGNYEARDALLIFNTTLDSDDSPTDKLVVEGDTTGNGYVTVNNVGGMGSKTVNGIELIEVQGNSAAVFTKTGRIVAGAYDYNLVKKGSNWYLTNLAVAEPTPTPIPEPEPTPPPVPDPEPQPSPESLYRPEIGSYLANIMAANTIFNTRLHDRLGESQYTDALTGEKKVTSMWIRHTGGHNRFKDGSGQISTQSNRYVMQLGGDIAQWSSNGLDRLHLGLMAGYANSKSRSHSSLTGYASRGEISGYSTGVYGTWYANEQDKTGAYVDSWLLYNWFDNTASGQGLTTEKYDSDGITASIEAGYTSRLGESNNGRDSYWLQPKVQVIWMDVQAERHVEKNGTRVTDDTDGNLQTRLGVKAYIQGNHASDDGKDRTFQPFAEANWIYNSSNYTVQMNDVRNEAKGTRNIGELKLGVEGKINNRLQLWGNVAQQLGDSGYSDTVGMLGAKYTF